MSGPVAAADAAPNVVDNGHAEAACIEVSDAREATVGRFHVRRALPQRHRRTVGAWCFADHMGPAAVSETSGLDIGPHPHIGLQTVTWLLAGEALHRDSLGSEQMLRAGQLNLMTAGGGVAHSEEATGAYSGQLHGIQLWVALPEATRHGPAAFEHHTDLPVVDIGRAEVTVLTGDVAGTASPARQDTPLVGADVRLDTRDVSLPLRADFEHALVVLDGAVDVHGQRLRPGRLGYLGLGRDELMLHADAPARVMLLGGEPFPERILMWWNFVARSREEVAAATADWEAGADRFGRVASPLARVPAPPPPWR